MKYRTGDYINIHPSIKVFGELTKGNCPLEDTVCQTLINQQRKHFPSIMMFHIKNEGKRTAQQMQKEQSIGFIKGASDYCLVGQPMGFLEVKRANYSHKVKPEQERFLLQAQEKGAIVGVALGSQGCVDFLKYWLDMQINKH